MLLAEVVETSDLVASTSSRNRKIGAIAELLSRTPVDELEAAVAFLAGEPRQGKIGVGFAAVFGVDVAPAAAPSLHVAEVDRWIGRMAAIGGPGSVGERTSQLRDLLSRATSAEQGFLRRLLTGELRQGALEGVMMPAIARAAEIPAGIVRRAVMLRGDLPSVARTAFSEGEARVAAIGLEVLRPVRPMLAKTGEDVAAALEEVGRASVEWKLDGARVQAHRRRAEIRVFTRNLKDVTERLPAVVEAVSRLDVSSVVLDGESMALGEDGLPRPFQETMSSFGADLPRGEATVLPFFFDILHQDGVDLIDLPLEARLERLDAVVPEPLRVPRVVTSDPVEAERFLEEARRLRHEGVMVKALSSRYAAGDRGADWVKVKPAHTLDLVILAAEWGHGRRRGWLSNLHLGARDEERGGFVMLGKTFKGLTDEMLAWQTGRLLELEVRRDGNVVHTEPVLVAEIAFDGVLASPRYPSGMALRFARVKGYRPDKGPEDADTIETVRAIFEGRRLQGPA